jgi:hypothetical protein
MEGSSEKRISKGFRNLDHPVCAAEVASRLLLMAQPPLLRQEGSGRSSKFIHTFTDTGYSRGCEFAYLLLA